MPCRLPAAIRLLAVIVTVIVFPEIVAPKLTLTGASAILAFVDERAFARPAPTMFTFVLTPVPVELSRTPWSAVFTIAERTSADDHVGCWLRTTAAAPARCGVAIDVPWKNAQHGGVSHASFGCELSTLTPGATTSGLTRKSTSVGP